MKRIFLVLCLLLIATTSSANREGAPFLLAIQEVQEEPGKPLRFFVTATDGKGNPLGGMRKGDFSLKIGEKEIQDFSMKPLSSKPLYLTIVLDISGSMHGAPLAESIKAVSLLLNRFNEDDRVSLVVFGSEVKTLVDSTLDKDLVLQKMDNLKGLDQKTLFYQGMYDTVWAVSAEPSLNSALVLITDGKDEGSKITAAKLLSLVKASRVPVYAIGVGKTVDGYLKRLASLSGGHLFLSTAYEDVLELSRMLSSKRNDTYVLSGDFSGPPGKYTAVVQAKYLTDEATAVKDFTYEADKGSQPDAAPVMLMPSASPAPPSPAAAPVQAPDTVSGKAPDKAPSDRKAIAGSIRGISDFINGALLNSPLRTFLFLLVLMVSLVVNFIFLVLPRSSRVAKETIEEAVVLATVGIREDLEIVKERLGELPEGVRKSSMDQVIHRLDEVEGALSTGVTQVQSNVEKGLHSLWADMQTRWDAMEALSKKELEDLSLSHLEMAAASDMAATRTQETLERITGQMAMREKTLEERMEQMQGFITQGPAREKSQEELGEVIRKELTEAMASVATVTSGMGQELARVKERLGELLDRAIKDPMDQVMQRLDKVEGALSAGAVEVQNNMEKGLRALSAEMQARGNAASTTLSKNEFEAFSLSHSEKAASAEEAATRTQGALERLTGQMELIEKAFKEKASQGMSVDVFKEALGAIQARLEAMESSKETKEAVEAVATAIARIWQELARVKERLGELPEGGIKGSMDQVMHRLDKVEGALSAGAVEVQNNMEKAMSALSATMQTRWDAVSAGSSKKELEAISKELEAFARSYFEKTASAADMAATRTQGALEHIAGQVAKIEATFEERLLQGTSVDAFPVDAFKEALGVIQSIQARLVAMESSMEQMQRSVAQVPVMEIEGRLSGMSQEYRESITAMESTLKGLEEDMHKFTQSMDDEFKAGFQSEVAALKEGIIEIIHFLIVLSEK